MKIIMNDCVYVQKHDLVYLLNNEQNILSSVFNKLFGDTIFIVNDDNRYEFVKFDTLEEIEYFKNLDWIIDYNAVKDLSEEEFIKLGEELAMDMNSLANIFNEMNEDERASHLELIEAHEKCEFKMYSLRDILWFKQGHIKMNLPEGVEYPVGYVDHTQKECEQKKEKGLRRILSKFKKH